MKKFFGIISIAAGVFFGLYVGLYWAFIGGIMQIVDAFNATPVDGAGVAFGVVRIFLATTLGEIVAWLFFMIGIALIFNHVSIMPGHKKRGR